MGSSLAKLANEMHEAYGEAVPIPRKCVTACVNVNLIGTYGEIYEFLLYLHSV